MDNYFERLAERALVAKRSDYTQLETRVFAFSQRHAPKKSQARTTVIEEEYAKLTPSIRRDRLQAAIAEALSPSQYEKSSPVREIRSSPPRLWWKSSPAQQRSPILEPQIEALSTRIDRINELLREIPLRFGDWGWQEQVKYLGERYRIKNLKREHLRDFLRARESPVADQPKIKNESAIAAGATGRQDLNRLHDVETLVKSYIPLLARRLASSLTLSQRIESIFKEYGLSEKEQTKDALSKILSGQCFPESLDPQLDVPAGSEKVRKQFQNWPCAAIGGSFAQGLASELDFRPSTWVLSRELEEQHFSSAGPAKPLAAEGPGSGGLGGRGSDQKPPGINGSPQFTPNDEAWRAGLMGLAFSGGGIRSATFNLGVLQGLASLGLLKKIDYLSSVSGGGYIGAWLINWIRRKGIDEVEKRLCPDSTPDPRDLRLEPIRFLRDFSNYLTPQVGLLSADTWVMAVVWIRNTILNLLVLLPAVLSVLLIPRVPELWAQSIAAAHFMSFDPRTADQWPPFISLSDEYGYILAGCVACFTILIGWNLRKFSADENDRGGEESHHTLVSRPWGILTFIILPIFVAAWLGSIELWVHAGDRNYLELRSAGVWGAIVAGGILLIAKYPWRFGKTRAFKLTLRGVAAMAVVVVAIDAVSVLLTIGLGSIFSFWRGRDLPNTLSSARVTVFGVPLVVTALFFTLIILAGFMSQKLTDGGSKWLVRLRAYVAIYSTIWLVWTGIAIYGPWLYDHILAPPITKWRLAAKWPVAAAWLWTTVRGVLAGKSSDTHGGKADWKSSLGFYATVGPYVFIIGLFWAMSVAADRALNALSDYLKASGSNQPWLTRFLPCAVLGHEWTWSVFMILIGAAFLAVWLSAWFDVNEFSLNKFYRSRLVRCYLGASNEDRKPNPFTGFDSADDGIPLSCFQKHPPPDIRDVCEEKYKTPYNGPFPIFNATLNLVHGDELAWQERRGASFVFTPQLCGYETPWHAPANPQQFKKLEFLGYRDTQDYAYPKPGMHLGIPMSVSGAALSPNMGFYSRAATGFLMTVFNARLGWWLGNPRHKQTWTKAGPTQGLAYLTKELMGLTNDRAAFVYVSDGGHFENLAIYELVRRRCRYIIACDGEEDAKLAFNGLGNAIRKCRMDFGVEIDIGVDLIKPESSGLLSRSHCVVGTIQYPDQVGLGYLVYLKASIVGDEPEDVLQYRVSYPAFPHQSTADQWFTESQFESYRRLGLHVANTTFKRAVGDLKNQSATSNDQEDEKETLRKYRQELFEELRDNWYPPVKAIQANFTRHSQALDDLVREMRGDKVLVKLDDVLIPVRNPRQPVISDSEKPKVFLFLSSVIQLIENIYIDLDLESNADHPHCAGWIQIFQAWAETEIFQQAWSRYGWTYGRNFRLFCNRRFGLPL